MNKEKILKNIGTLLLASAFIAGCSSSLAGTSEDEGTASIPESNQDKKEINIAAVDFAYQPEQLEVKSGQAIKINFENEGELFHDWVIEEMPVQTNESKSEHKDDGHAEDGHAEDGHAEDGHADGGTEDDGHDDHGNDFAVHVSAEAGKQSAVTFTPTEVGEYTYYCSVPGHKEAGMVGTITVID